MAITRQQVFLASQFDEFAELRAVLVRRIDSVLAPPLEAIDLNDNRVNERPPLHRCLGAVRRAEIVIVLVGERYGSLPPHQRLSYTHLEYRTAVEEKKTVLPFFIGPAYRDRLKEFSSDLHMAKWQQEIQENHTAPFLCDHDPERLAEVIFDNLLVRVWELFAHPAEDRDSWTDAGDDGPTPDLSQLSPVGVNSLLEPSVAAGSDPAREMLALLARPAEVAAAEHAREAHRAIELGEMGGGIHHLRRALDLRPLHVARGYWLARLLVAKGTRLECNEAVRFARTAARLAQREGSELWEAAALVVAARGATRAGEADAGLAYAEQAVEVARWHWATHLELACQHAERGDADATFRAAERAFRLRPETISYLHHEPAIRAFGAEYDHFRRDLRERTREQVARILQSEAACRALDAPDGAPAVELGERLGRLEELRLPELVREGRQSGERQFELLRAEADDLLRRAQPTDHQTLDTLDGTVRGLAAKKTHIEKVDRLAIPLVVLALAAAAVGGVWLRAVPVGTMLIIAAVLGAIVFARWRLTRSRTRADIGARLAEAIRVRDGQATAHAALVDRTRTFQAAVATFERTVLSHFLFSPRFSWQADGDECIRVDTERTHERYPGFEFQTELLPPRLALVASEDPPPARFRLFRIVGQHGNVRVASRSAAYFSPPAAQAS